MEKKQSGIGGVPGLVGLPEGMEWLVEPVSWSLESGVLSITAGAKTDWFISPTDGARAESAPCLTFAAGREFTLTALVSAEMNSQWDAGALMVFVDRENWGKIAFEKSAYQEPTIVSVVTKGVSDDCNGEAWAGGSVWLRIGTVGQGIGLYNSADGVKWRMARVFSLGVDGGLQIGFEAQSPTGQGATATFQEISYRAQGIEDQFAGE